MKAKYSIGQVVKIKATGEKVKIISIVPFVHVPAYWIDTDEIQGIYVFESELKAYCPTRTGKYRNKRGQFVSKKSNINICSWCDTWFYDIGKHLMHCSMRKAAQEQREQFSCGDIAECPYCDQAYGSEGRLKDHIEVTHPDSKQRNYQKILTALYRIEKKIDELGRKV